MELPYEIYEGDSSPIVYVRPNITDPTAVISADWSCKVSLIGPDGIVIVPARVSSAKSTDNLHFAIQLSPTETDMVNVKNLPITCQWIVQIENSLLTPAYSRERQIVLIVKKKGIA